jgi:hypothetical protein
MLITNDRYIFTSCFCVQQLYMYFDNNYDNYYNVCIIMVI